MGKGGGGGGGPPPPTESTVTQTNLPEYVSRILKKYWIEHLLNLNSRIKRIQGRGLLDLPLSKRRVFKLQLK